MKQVQFLVTLNVSEAPQDNEHIEAATKVALNKYLVDTGLSSEADPAIVHGVESVKRVEQNDKPFYVVWNSIRSEGFVTIDKQLAYETRKCATTNLADEMGNPSSVAREFCERWGDDDLTMEVLEMSDRLDKFSDADLENLFQYYSNACERGRWSHVRNRRDKHPTVHAIMLLNELACLEGENGPQPMEPRPQQVGFLNHDSTKFKRNATREHVLELVRCNVRFTAKDELFDLGPEGNK